MKGHPIRYSDEELRWIEVRTRLPRAELQQLLAEAFGRNDVTAENLKKLCIRKGWKTGRTGRFGPGRESHNKGCKGVYAPGSEKGWFKKGKRHGKAARLYQPIGSERVSSEGYVQRKVNDDMPLHRRWRGVHLIRWEEMHGPLPEGHALKCLDGDRQNTDPHNWLCIPRALLPRLAGRWRVAFDDAPAGLKPALLAIAKLENAARQARKGERWSGT